MRQVSQVGCNSNVKKYGRYDHETTGFGEVNEERSISHGRHRLKLRHNGYVVFDRTTEGEISAQVVDEMVRAFGYFLGHLPATSKQLGRLEILNRSLYHKIKKGMSEFFRPKLITNLMVEGVLMAEQGKIDKYGPVEPPATVEAANSNDGGSVKPSELAKVYSVAALGVAEATATKQLQQLPLPFADNDNEEWLSSFKVAKILGVTPPTLRNWLYYGRPVVGLRRKKRKELNAKMVGGHLKSKAASVHALAKKISRSI